MTGEDCFLKHLLSWHRIFADKFRFHDGRRRCHICCPIFFFFKYIYFFLLLLASTSLVQNRDAYITFLFFYRVSLAPFWIEFIQVLFHTNVPPSSTWSGTLRLVTVAVLRLFLSLLGFADPRACFWYMIMVWCVLYFLFLYFAMWHVAFLGAWGVASPAMHGI